MDSIDHYQLLGEIARGGMGVVYRAQDPSGRVVALKVLLDHDPDSVERFQREAQLAHRLEHPNVVRVWGHGVSRGRPYLVMDYVEGEDLMARLKRDGPLPETEARRLFLLLGQALSAAHALGIVHRDLKPQNVLLRGAEVYLTDFGLARRGPSTLTATGELLGTPAYMAPEQAIGERDATSPASDVYGFGATLYAALCGEPPHRGPNLYGTLDLVLNAEPPPLRARRAQDLSPQLEALVVACLRKDASERPTLEDVLRGLSGEGAAVGAGRGRVGVVALVCVLSLGALALAWALTRDAGTPPPPTRAASPSLASSSPPSPPSPSPLASSAKREAAERLAETALEALTRYEYDLAQESFEGALVKDPDCQAAHTAKALWAFSTNRFALAVESSERVGPAAPPELRARAHYARGRALTRQFEDLPPADAAAEAAYYARCQEAFQASLNAQPSARAWAWLARVQVMAGDREAAASSLARGREVDRLDPHLAVLNQDLEPRPETLDAFTAEGQEGSLQTRRSFELGLRLVAYSVGGGRGPGLPKRARDVLAQVRRIRPNETSVIAERIADAYVQRARRGLGSRDTRQSFEQARDHLKRALEGAPPGSLRRHLLLSSYGTVNLYLGDSQVAIQHLEAAFKIKPSAEVRETLLLSLLPQTSTPRGNWNAAGMEVLLARAREVSGVRTPKFLQVRLARLEAWALTIRSDFPAAEERFAEALALGEQPWTVGREESQRAREQATTYVARGRSRLLAKALGRPSQSAVADFRRALEADPRSPMAAAWLAHGIHKKERVEALKVARSVQDQAPVGHPARVVAELILASKDQAWAALVAYLEIEPGNPQFLGQAMRQDFQRALPLVAVPGPHAKEHPLVVLASSRAGRLREGASPEWYRKVEARLTKELEAHPDFGWLLAERGLIRAKLGEQELARADLERARRILADPSLQGALDTLDEPR